MFGLTNYFILILNHLKVPKHSLQCCIPVIENPKTQQNIMLKDEDWKVIFKNANSIFLNFTERLKNQYPAGFSDFQSQEYKFHSGA